jgi:hypothetical protein
MALSEFTRKLVETRLAGFCRENIPFCYRSRIRIKKYAPQTGFVLDKRAGELSE